MIPGSEDPLEEGMAAHPWKISHIAEKIEKSWQKIAVEFASCNGFLGDLRPRLFFLLQFNFLGVFLSAES